MNQLQMLRKMTGEQRLDKAIQLSELNRKRIIVKIKKELGPQASRKLVLKKLIKRLHPELFNGQTNFHRSRQSKV